MQAELEVGVTRLRFPSNRNAFRPPHGRNCFEQVRDEGRATRLDEGVLSKLGQGIVNCRRRRANCAGDLADRLLGDGVHEASQGDTQGNPAADRAIWALPLTVERHQARVVDDQIRPAKP